jgi:hypothetical protein
MTRARPRSGHAARADCRPDGLPVALSQLNPPLTPGDGIIVTPVFARSCPIGAVSHVE